MKARGGPTPKVNVENSWLNKSLEDRIGILRHVAPKRADAVSLLVDAALREEWDAIGPTTKQARDGGDR